MAEMLKGERAVGGLELLEVRNAIARAKRTKRGKDGRELQMGGNVAEMVTRLLVWEGSGEADDYWVHKTNKSWHDDDGTLTEADVRSIHRERFAPLHEQAGG